MPSVHVNNINMYYEQYGKGIPLVLIAGFSCNHLFWHPLASLLAENFQVLIFDNRGCGKSDTPDGIYTMKDFAADTASLMRVLHIENAYVLGHSMGGAILQQLCNDYPQLVRKAIICSSLAKTPSKTLLQIEAQAFLQESGASTEALILNSLPWLYSNEFLSVQQNVMQTVWKLLHNPYPQSRKGFLAQGEALKRFDSSPFLKEIKTPTMVLVGDEDPLTPSLCSEFIANKIPQAKLQILKGQSHLFIEEKSSELIRIINSFFKN